MQIKISDALHSLSPMSCTVFLTHTVVWLEGDLGAEIWEAMPGRLKSRFGRIDYWCNGLRIGSQEEGALGAETSASPRTSEGDLFILVGKPKDLLGFKDKIQTIQGMIIVITQALEKEYTEFREIWPKDSTVFLGLDPECPPHLGARILDSLVGLFDHYEEGLSRFSLYDLRQIWLNDSDLGAELRSFDTKAPYASRQEVNLTQINALPLSTKGILIVVRSAEALASEVKEKLLNFAAAKFGNEQKIYWYVIHSQQVPTAEMEAVIFYF